ncbi:hypothetical protein K6L05_00415 [Salinicoccus roseus]|uniref:hypothetical protein n=1 Tax=Salinicoccus roseus TaxID=45670 RepID=UPI001CA71F72|nr:hypothetical protein [Salinicoccus roseus]MBY8908247.1 hypothetical protein [Salinicoccus roseus]
MKLVLLRVLLILVVIFPFYINQVVEAAEDASLQEAEVDINAIDPNNYEISQNITINGSGIEEVEHILSKVNDVKIENVSFSSNGTEINSEIIEGETLIEYIIPISDPQSNSFNYEVSFNVQMEDEEFTVPLMIPTITSSGEGNIVSIVYEGPEDKIIQGNSFPVVKGEPGNTDSSYLMNIPSHVKYVLGDEDSFFNTFNLIGWGTLLIFLFIVIVWVRSEAKAQKEIKAQREIKEQRGGV